ncbi:hypothetical protein evm_011380 [Chilo suppressalis]|nr:hypothetical protein evm_011380 [Chilo suppressalis]
MAQDKVEYSSVGETDKFEDLKCAQNIPKGFGVRHLQVLLLFISLSVGYAVRAQLSVSMVAMTTQNLESIEFSHINIRNNRSLVVYKNEENSTDSNSSDKTTNLRRNRKTGTRSWTVYRTYSWDKPTQEMILFSFFVGYTSMMLPMGIISQRYGGKIPILIALAVNGVLSILSPWVPLFAGWMGMCVCRLLQGMTQAAYYPSIHTILGKWAPLSERGRLTTYVYTGSQFGTVAIFQVSGLFAGTPSLGWPATFWLCGIFSLLCFALYYWLGSAAPQSYRGITKEELHHIMGDGSADVKKRETPWKHILTSTAVCGLVVSHAGSVVGHLLMLIQTPTYMSKVLKVDIRQNGVYSSLPYIAMYILAITFGHISDKLHAKKLMSIVNIRRTANTIGMMVSGIFMIAFAFVTNTTLAVILLILCIGLHSGVHVGFHINQLDLAPNFAGPIMALGNMVANLVSLLVPVLVSNIVGNDVTNQHRWQILFIVVASFQILTNTIFVIFVKGKVQQWNFYGADETEKEEDLCVLKENNRLFDQEPQPIDKKQQT